MEWVRRNDTDDASREWREIGSEENSDEKEEESDKIESEDDIALDDIADIYKELDVEIDKNAAKTSDLIEKALDDEKAIENKLKSLIEFDTSEDNSMFDMNLRDVY